METKYNILWFDDYFSKPTIDSSDDFIDNYNNINEYAEIAFEQYGLNCCGVDTIENFGKELTSSHKYQAVILDLRGLDPNDSTNDRIAFKAAKIALDIPDLVVFVFSQNSEQDKFEGLRESIPDERFLKKGGIREAKVLFSKIKETLDHNLHFYQGHEECLALFNERILESILNKRFMDKILSKYRADDKLYAPFNPMRQILEEMLIKLVSIGTIANKKGDDKYETFNHLIYLLAEECFKDSNDKVDYEHPKISFEVCPREIKYSLCFLRDITNKYSHFLDKNKIEIRDYDTLGCNFLIQQAAYNAFFAVMKWFYAFYHNQNSKKNGPYEIQLDEYNNVYHCGEYLIPSFLVTNGQYNLGEKAFVIEMKPNTDSKTKLIYPNFAKICKSE